MTDRAIRWSGILGFAVLATWCLWRDVPRVEADLTVRSRAVLTAAGLTTERVTFTGQDSWLSGPLAAPDLASLARTVMEGVRGLRTVWTNPEEPPAPKEAVSRLGSGPAPELQTEMDRLVAGGRKG